MEEKAKKFLKGKVYLLAIILCASVIAVVTYLLQDYTRSLLRQNLDARLISTAGVAALAFDGDEIERLSLAGENAFSDPAYRKNVLKLQRVRRQIKDSLYAYILRQTEDRNTVTFVVDADAISNTPVIDFNEDGEVNDDDVSTPGEAYDASEVPALLGPAFVKATVDAEPSSDEWGNFLSAYAPIKNSGGVVVGTLTIDVEVSEYFRTVQATVLPFALFIALLILLITTLSAYLVKSWKAEVELAKEVDRQKDELLSMVSHQLATPISSVKWYVEMLLDGDLGKLSSEQQESLNTVQSVASGLSELVSMILDVSRVQLGKMKVEPQELDLAAFFEEILAIIEPKAIEKKVLLVKELPKEWPKAKLDKRLTRMTIENLLSNAVKYTPSNGTVKFKIKIDQGKLFCEVTDSGCGIPEKDQDKIFGKLFRASNVRNSVDGNGFGLYVAKGSIESQGGSINFKSKEGVGTSFFVMLPLNT